MKRGLAVFCLVVATGLCGLARAQVAGPQLTLSTSGGQTTFRMGERIPLELAFTGPSNGQYQVITDRNVRTPGVTWESVKVSPDGGWVDPLKIYFGSLLGYGGDWMSSIALLSAKPEIVPIDLNKWVRFDEPGKYQVAVTSRRALDTLARKTGLHQDDTVTLTSNPIEIQIVPATAAWQKAKLAEIEAALSKPMKENSPLSPEQGAAMADLRALGTAGAAALMAKHLRSHDALFYDCSYGLMGLPEAVRPAALDDLNTEMDNPQFPISGRFLDTMAVLQISDGPPAAMRAQRQQLRNQAWQAAFEALDSKQGKARAATVDTLLNSAHKGETPQQKAEMGRILAASLTDLSPLEQAGALENNWDLIRPNVTVAELQAMAQTPLKNPESNAEEDYAKREMKSAALRRWYELDPTGAQQKILQEIGTQNPELTAHSLAFLPKEKLPQFESMWAQQFAATDDYQREAVLAGLLAKFGEGDAVGLVESKAQAKVGKWACAPQSAALAYLAEFDPDSALPLIKRAEQSSCQQMLFQDMSRYTHAPALTRSAVAAVNDPSPVVATDALWYLSRYGDASAKPAILARFAAWSEQWRGRADELEARTPGARFPTQQHMKDIVLGENLVETLLANQGWLATPDLFRRVMAGCVSEQVCSTAKTIAHMMGHGPYTIMPIASPETDQRFQIAQYEIGSLDLLDAKIAQFPKGSQFVLPAAPENSDDRKIEDKVKAILARNGMVLVKRVGTGAA